MGNRRHNFRIIEGAGLYCQPIFFNRSEDQRRSAICAESSFRIMGRFKELRFTLCDFEFVLLDDSSRCDNTSRPSLAHPAMAIQILRFCRRRFVPNCATKATPCPSFHVDPRQWVQRKLIVRFGSLAAHQDDISSRSALARIADIESADGGHKKNPAQGWVFSFPGSGGRDYRIICRSRLSHFRWSPDVCFRPKRTWAATRFLAT